MLVLAHALWSTAADILPQRLSAAWSQKLPRALQAGAEAYIATNIAPHMFYQQTLELRALSGSPGEQPQSSLAMPANSVLVVQGSLSTPWAAAFTSCADAQLVGSSLACFLRGQVSLERWARCAEGLKSSRATPASASSQTPADEEPAVFSVSFTSATRQIVANRNKAFGLVIEEKTVLKK
jgi:hypothetical protein